MSTQGIEIQDASGNVYYPHTDSSFVRYDNDKTIKEKIDNINTDLNEIAQKTTLQVSTIEPLSGWEDLNVSNPATIGKSVNSTTLLADLQKGITTNDTKILQLPSWAYPYRTRSFQVTSCGEDWVYKVGVITINTAGEVILSGNVSNTKLIIAVTYQN